MSVETTEKIHFHFNESRLEYFNKHEKRISINLKSDALYYFPKRSTGVLGNYICNVKLIITSSFSLNHD